MTREVVVTDAGPEVLCSKCKQLWPRDAEFFFFTKGKPHSWCKACYREDSNQVAKDARWRAGVRKSAPPPPAVRPDWNGLARAFSGPRDL